MEAPSIGLNISTCPSAYLNRTVSPAVYELHAVPLGASADEVALVQIVSVGDSSRRIGLSYGMSGVQVPVLTRHHTIDAFNVGSVMVVLAGGAYVPDPSVMDGVAVGGTIAAYSLQTVALILDPAAVAFAQIASVVAGFR
jgi:hypothetical protein